MPGNDERRPTVGSGVQVDHAGSDDRDQSSATAGMISYLAGDDPTELWARPRISAGREAGPIPPYGSPSWHALPPGDARRWAAVLIAAEAHRIASPAHPWGAALLSAELGAGAVQHAADDAEWRALAGRAVRFAEGVDRARAAGSDTGLPLAARLEVARRPRPGDHAGGPVPAQYPARARERGAA